MPPAGPTEPSAPDRPGPGWPSVPDSGEELAVVTRSGFVESRHVGHGVVLAPDGEVVVAVGDPQALIDPRSSLKPVQAATCLLAGADLSGAALAIGAGSHHGHPDHRDLVTHVLDGAGLSPEDLQTPPALPTQDWARDEVLRSGGGPEPLHHNCSGKHAAMLVACVAAGWDTTTYRDPDHPLQERIRAATERATGVPVTHVGVDGCGAPLFSTTLAGLARVGATVGRAGAEADVGAGADSEDGATGSGDGGTGERSDADTALVRALGAVGAAMHAQPWAVAGTGVVDTVVMEALPGVVAKGGAEGVMLLGTANGHGVAVKVLDGSGRAAMPAALALLAAAGIEAGEVANHVAVPVLGHGHAVGRVHASDLVVERAARARR